MHRYAVVALVCATAACNQPPAASTPATPASAATAPAATAPVTGASTAGADATTVSGTVAETMNSGGYTYARLTGGSGETWMAAAEFPIVKGATISAAVDMPMRNFRSRTLNREFTEIYFVRDVVMNGTPVAATSGDAAGAAGATGGSGAPAMAGSHGGAEAPEPEPTLIAAVPPVPGSVKIADLWKTRKALSGKPVVVRGQVVKVNYEIMGTNWYHLQDGSGVIKDGTHDLVVTSAAQVKAGDVVTVSGLLTTDKDFGAGYAYEAIIEKADIRK